MSNFLPLSRLTPVVLTALLFSCASQRPSITESTPGDLSFFIGGKTYCDYIPASELKELENGLGKVVSSSTGSAEYVEKLGNEVCKLMRLRALLNGPKWEDLCQPLGSASRSECLTAAMIGIHAKEPFSHAAVGVYLAAGVTLLMRERKEAKLLKKEPNKLISSRMLTGLVNSVDQGIKMLQTRAKPDDWLAVKDAKISAQELELSKGICHRLNSLGLKNVKKLEALNKKNGFEYKSLENARGRFLASDACNLK